MAIGTSGTIMEWEYFCQSLRQAVTLRPLQPRESESLRDRKAWKGPDDFQARVVGQALVSMTQAQLQRAISSAVLRHDNPKFLEDIIINELYHSVLRHNPELDLRNLHVADATGGRELVYSRVLDEFLPLPDLPPGLLDKAPDKLPELMTWFQNALGALWPEAKSCVNGLPEKLVEDAAMELLSHLPLSKDTIESLQQALKPANAPTPRLRGRS